MRRACCNSWKSGGNEHDHGRRRDPYSRRSRTDERREVGELFDHSSEVEWPVAFIIRNAPEFLFLTVCSIFLAGVVYLFLI
jgi:hypothetical protein